MPRRRNALITLLLPALALAGAACGGASGQEGSPPATLHPIAGSDVSRLVLMPSASRNIGIRTASVRLTRVERTIMVPGAVIGETSGGSIVRVQAPLTAAELRAVDRGKPARILGLGGDAGLVAMPAPTQAGAALDYRLEGAAAAAGVPGHPVRVQLTLTDGGLRKAVPYSSLLYWVDGRSWVYTRTAPLTFVRRPVRVAYVNGNEAVLRSGPPVGTTVVRVGASELLGTEFEIEGE
jgi:hypothetical protein